MNTKKLYQIRFSDQIKQRYDLWLILIKYFFQKFIDEKDTVLDLGCGYGEFINQIYCGKKYAIDLNPDSTKYLNKNITFYRQSSTKMKSIKSNSIEKIFISNFFEHLTRDDIILTIKESHRVLKKGGRVLILQPNIRFCEKDYWMFFDHVTPIDDRALEEVFSSHSFQLKKRILRFLPFTTKSNFPKSSIFIKTYLKLPFLWRFFGQQSFLIFEKL